VLTCIKHTSGISQEMTADKGQDDRCPTLLEDAEDSRINKIRERSKLYGSIRSLAWSIRTRSGFSRLIL
jgi:hypothetical protein